MMRATCLGWILALNLITIATVTVALTVGSVSLSVGQSSHALLALLTSNQSSNTAIVAIVQLRLCRAANAFTTGGLLSLAGCLMQVLLQNPLADPYILGVSGGASSFVLLGILLGFGWHYLPALGFIGALLSSLIVYRLSYRQHSWSSTQVLLTGVIVASAWGAIISFILSISTNTNLPGMLFWLLGSLQAQKIHWLGSGMLVISLIYSISLATKLNLLSQGETTAQLLGLSIKRLQLQLFFLSSLLTALAVCIAGNIGFIGLMVPHLVRLGISYDHKTLLPCAVILGGNLLVLADVLARSVLSPIEIPVGIFTTLLGIPVFLFLMARQYARTNNH